MELHGQCAKVIAKLTNLFLIFNPLGWTSLTLSRIFFVLKIFQNTIIKFIYLYFTQNIFQ
jgi:hypothetical protein